MLRSTTHTIIFHWRTTVGCCRTEHTTHDTSSVKTALLIPPAEAYLLFGFSGKAIIVQVVGRVAGARIGRGHHGFESFHVRQSL
jgi:hypothetical protein